MITLESSLQLLADTNTQARTKVTGVAQALLHSGVKSEGARGALSLAKNLICFGTHPSAKNQDSVDVLDRVESACNVRLYLKCGGALPFWLYRS